MTLYKEVEMTNFELFTMMYFVLDTELEKINRSDELLLDYVSNLNPFLWNSEDSADPAYFSEFNDFMKDKVIGDDYGYSLIVEFIKTNDEYYFGLEKYFLRISVEEFKEAFKRYLSERHKGDENWLIECFKKV